MARLEYRLCDEAKGYPLLYFYDGINRDEISVRFACDYFVKERVVYEKISCAIEASVYVIYVQEDNEAIAFPHGQNIYKAGTGVSLELRNFVENSLEYPLIHKFEFSENQDVLLHLQSDYVLWMGREWHRTSAELDEDRKTYVYYANAG